MLIKIDFESETPIYTQIKDQVVVGIAEGAISEKESLPSVRQLAGDLGINMHTVNKAYSILKDEGFLIVHRRKGAMINEFAKMKNFSYTKEISQSIKPIIAEAYCKGISEEKFIEQCKKIYQSLNGRGVNGNEK
jgi:DNA-binding transcriptional regulator YhcF (GntR family)